MSRLEAIVGLGEAAQNTKINTTVLQQTSLDYRSPWRTVVIDVGKVNKINSVQ